jgi:hypothetical protein
MSAKRKKKICIRAPQQLETRETAAAEQQAKRGGNGKRNGNGRPEKNERRKEKSIRWVGNRREQ